VPVLLALCVVLVSGVAAATALLVRPASRGASVNPSAATLSPSSPAPSPSGLLISCWGHDPGFPPAMLKGSGTAENEGSPAAGVLRAVLGDPSAAEFPKTGWHRVYTSSDDVLFVAAGRSDVAGHQMVEVAANPDGPFAAGGWSMVRSGTCGLRTLPPEGYGVATWTPEPGVRLISGTTDVPVFVQPEICYGWNTPAPGRI
jgi:hypothetical protein